MNDNSHPTPGPEEEMFPSSEHLVPSQTMKRRNRGKKKSKKNMITSEGDGVIVASDGNIVESRDNTNEVSNKVKKQKLKQKKLPSNLESKAEIINSDDANNVKENKKKEAKDSNHVDAHETRNAETAKRKKSKKGKKLSNHPWKSLLPHDAMDPITLEPLSCLNYPPFALTISPPYDPVVEWPVPDDKNQKDNSDSKQKDAKYYAEEARKREQQVMQEQWGSLIPQKPLMNFEKDQVSINVDVPESSSNTLKTPTHYHLFDGKALAYYLVSTLQFIDPLNRRDLTRPEIMNLDAYLAKHQLKKMRVLEAYDEKGISISSAGANAQSQSGRLRIRQEEARNLLNSLFTVGRGRDGVEVSGSIDRRPSARQSGRQRNRSPEGALDLWNQDGGIMGEESGMMIIDDDLNPGLRGGLNRPVDVATSSSNNLPPSNWQPNYLAQRYGHSVRALAENFPSLPSISVQGGTTRAENEETESTFQPKVVSKSLSKIGSAVKKTDPKELEKQRKAREDALRKAEISTLTVEDALRQMNLQVDQIPSAVSHSGMLPVPIISKPLEPTQGQIERNRNLAAALGVAPVTLRQNITTGWARPTSFEIDVDEFGNELNRTQYPDSLILAAKDKMVDLVRVEKKWKAFLEDDKSASCHLKAMDKPARKFFHEYSDFWNLHTQSFDPAPNRYIQCTKTKDTRAPNPLLSDAVRSWKGPTSLPSSVGPVNDAHQIRSFGEPDHRLPLQIAPRTLPPLFECPPGTMYDMDQSRIAQSESVPQEPSARFSSMSEERQRQRLILDPRTKPLDLPPMNVQQHVDAFALADAYKKEKTEAIEKKKKKEEKKKRILAAAFASDDEESESESESDWEEQEAMVVGSDEED